MLMSPPVRGVLAAVAAGLVVTLSGSLSVNPDPYRPAGNRLFVAPILVILSYFIAPLPMDLVFTPAEVMAVVVSVLVVEQVAGDGKSNWFEGAQLLSLYCILAMVFYFLP